MKNTLLILALVLFVNSSNAQKVIKEYYDNGELKSIGYGRVLSGFFDDNIKENGEWKYYYDNGQLKKIGNFSNSSKIGLWKHYYENGVLSESYSMHDGSKIGILKEFDKNGTLVDEIDYDFLNEQIKKTKANGDIVFFALVKEGVSIGGNAQYHIGNYFYHGISGVDKNEKEAFKWFKRSAKNGDTEAQFYLGQGYLYGQGGLEKNEKEAFKYLKLSANKNNKEAQYIIGYMYHSGIGIPMDIEKAIYWYEKSGENGKFDGFVNIANIKLSGEKNIIDKMNNLGTSENDFKRYYELEKQKIEMYKSALYYFEKAQVLDNTNEQINETINSIKQILNGN